ncbi:protein of unknown function [Nitrospira japonica]|uniref:Uncharacterized protein n=1 Tax=Nitrospira japonica TaxID=1325564 RepID=A0A1W1I9J8_9BACT|nr:protein of unknown function [Nitrospira japonica]
MSDDAYDCRFDCWIVRLTSAMRSLYNQSKTDARTSLEQPCGVIGERIVTWIGWKPASSGNEECPATERCSV